MAHRFDFSFSGLKTAVARWVEARERAGEPVPVADVAASFQEAVGDVLTAKALDACRVNGVRTLVIGGGVAANSRLRALAEERAAKVGVQVRGPRPGPLHRQRRDGRRTRLASRRARGDAVWTCHPCGLGPVDHRRLSDFRPPRDQQQVLVVRATVIAFDREIGGGGEGPGEREDGRIV